MFIHLYFQDIPFLIIPGTYIIATGIVFASGQFCLAVCFTDILVYVVYIIRERRNVHSYVAWSRRELLNYYICLFNRRTTETSRYSPGYDDENDPNRRYLDSE